MACSRELSRPKVLIAMEPLVGGTLRHLSQFLEYTDPAEFDVHLAVSALRAPQVRSQFGPWQAQGWTVHEIPMCRELSPHRDALALRRLVELCRRERFDLVHTHSAKAGFLGRAAARLTGAATVHTPHVFPFGRGGTVRAEVLYLALEKLAGRWTDRLVLLSNYQANQVARYRLLPPERVVVIPNARAF